MSTADIAVVAADAAVAAGLGWWFFGPKPAAEAAEHRRGAGDPGAGARRL